MERPKLEKIRRKKKCRKDRFRSEHDARRRAERLNMRHYYCFHCNGFHLTSQEYRGV